MKSVAFAMLVPLAMVGCGRFHYDSGDAPRDADSGELDAELDARGARDAFADASDARDAFADDAPLDVTEDTALDAPMDAPIDGDGPDAETDAGPPPAPVSPFFPWNGYLTGSVNARLVAPLAVHPLRPRFRWLPSAGATSYEVEIDDSCDVEAFRTCAFASPEVAETTSATELRPSASLPLATTMPFPAGRRYYWRVRACNGSACSSFSEVRYLDVGRQASDFDGDGYADVVVGAWQQDGPELNEGQVFIFEGGPSGTSTTPNRSIDNPGDVASGYFGFQSAAAGDLNADGFADLVVAASEQASPESREGNVFVFYGRVGGIGAVPDVTIDSPTDTVSAIFGTAAAGVGDVDGDGYADVMIGARNHAATGDDSGSVYLFYGSASGIASAPDVTIESPSGQANGRFGCAVTGAGDLDGDGFADVIVGASGRAGGSGSEEGAAYVFRGARTGIDPTPAVTLGNPASLPFGVFGFDLANAGDLNGDGYADLVVGAYQQSSPEAIEGNAFVYHGSPTGIADTPSATLDNPTDEPNGYFGIAVSGAGDLDGDGFGDLVIGARGQDVRGGSDNGVAFVYYGSASGVSAPDVTLEAQGGGDFGFAVATPGDIDGDGFTELIVGAPFQEPGGNAYLYFGAASGIAGSADVTLSNPVAQPFGFFGTSVD